MGLMFYQAFNFNQYIGDWNTGEVTSMSSMFQEVTFFNQDIGNWNTGQVTSMNQMFQEVTFFNQDIGNWDTSKVTSMNSMFLQATFFNQDMSSLEQRRLRQNLFVKAMGMMVHIGKEHPPHTNRRGIKRFAQIGLHLLLHHLRNILKL